ncbi:hypothetical protein BDP27DRAFT_1407246 [Rhodocollybia butyracea]|uniref:Uncharacterized protein n=1 Tax=Rhodocollybia butyracea TaxID=206335 RepID=A0A9P5PB93_9AGAR|nr:hypothetical protein BDP27DRAFT_1407246 [Rhodocollybia butyracea]
MNEIGFKKLCVEQRVPMLLLGLGMERWDGSSVDGYTGASSKPTSQMEGRNGTLLSFDRSWFLDSFGVAEVVLGSLRTNPGQIMRCIGSKFWTNRESSDERENHRKLHNSFSVTQQKIRRFAGVEHSPGSRLFAHCLERSIPRMKNPTLRRELVVYVGHDGVGSTAIQSVSCHACIGGREIVETVFLLLLLSLVALPDHLVVHTAALIDLILAACLYGDGLAVVWCSEHPFLGIPGIFLKNKRGVLKEKDSSKEKDENSRDHKWEDTKQKVMLSSTELLEYDSFILLSHSFIIISTRKELEETICQFRRKLFAQVVAASAMVEVVHGSSRAKMRDSPKISEMFIDISYMYDLHRTKYKPLLSGSIWTVYGTVYGFYGTGLIRPYRSRGSSSLEKRVHSAIGGGELQGMQNRESIQLQPYIGWYADKYADYPVSQVVLYG